MKRYITLIFLIVATFYSSFAQIPEFLGIKIKDNLSTWKSSLSQKGFSVMQNKSTDDDTSSNMYFKGKYYGYDCIVNISYGIDEETISIVVVNILCKNTNNINIAFDANLNDFLTRYSSCKFEKGDDSVTFNYDEDNDDIVDMSIGLNKRFDTYSVNEIEMSYTLQISIINIKALVLDALLNAYGNIEPPTVLGIEFGSDKSTVKSALKDRYGFSNVSENNGVIELNNPTIGGFKFKFATFDFQYDKNKTYLSCVDFQTNYTFGQEKDAKDERDYLLSLIKPKYENSIESYTNDDGFKCYRFGTNPKDISRALGLITLQKGQGQDGVKRLYLHLSYGPINYIDPSSDF